MMITGRIWKDGNDWLAKSEAIDVCTQGTSQVDAAEMLADAIAVRVPPDQHRELAMEAAEQGVSLNRLISRKLSR